MLGTRPIASAPLASTGSGNLLITVSETLSISELITRRYDRSISDTLSFSESAVAFKLGALTVTDYLVLTEKISKFIAPISEGLGLNENVSYVLVSKSPLVIESVSLAELITKQKIINRTVSESITFTETTKKLQIASMSERVNIVEGINYSVQKRVGITDILQVVETISPVKPIKRASDPLGLIETVTYRLLPAPKPTESLALQESVSYRVLSRQFPNDTLELTEDVSYRLLQTRPSETLLITEDIKVNAIYHLSVCDDLYIADRVQKVKTASISESLTLTERLGKNNIHEKLNLQETVTTNVIYDACGTRTYIPDKGLKETISLTETITVNMRRSITISESVGVGESVIYR